MTDGDVKQKAVMPSQLMQVLKGSVLDKYIRTPVCDNILCPDAIAAFEKESCSTLTIIPGNSLYRRRREQIRPFVIKLLLYIGAIPGDRSYGLIARMIETLALYPGTELNALIDFYSQKSGRSLSSIGHSLDRNFNVYNPDLIARVTSFTHTEPLTSKDVLVDIAQYVRLVFYTEVSVF